MKKTKWVLTIFLTITLILSTFVVYAQPEEAVDTANDNASLLNELQLPADTPVETINLTQEDVTDEIINTDYGNLTIHDPRNIPLTKRNQLLSEQSETIETPSMTVYAHLM